MPTLIEIERVFEQPAFWAPLTLALIGAAYKWVAAPIWHKLVTIFDAVELIQAELKPNSGSSLRDAVNRIEEAMCRSDQRWRSAMNLLPFATWESGPNGTLEFTSRVFSVWTGRSGHELMGEGWLGMIHPDDRERVEREFAAAVKAQRYYDNEHRYLMADEQTCFPVHVRAYPIIDAGGKYCGHIGVAMREDQPDVCSIFATCPAMQEWQRAHG